MNDENKEVNELETKPEEDTANRKKVIHFAIGITVIILGVALAMRLGGEAGAGIIVMLLLYGFIFYNRSRRK